MKIVATIQADLEVTPLGTKSRLAAEVGGTPVLRRTVERLGYVKGLDAVYVLCPTPQSERCEALLAGTSAIVRGFDADPPPWARLVQTARKWSLDCWRGGIGGTTHFDEFTDARIISGLLRTERADAVLSAPAAAPLLDPALADQMIEHHRRTKDDSRLTFTQAPPGIAGIMLDALLVHELAEKGIPVGWVLSYKPDTPQKDLVFQPCCCEIPADLRYAVGRLTADTERSTKRLAALLQDHAEPDCVTVGRWLREQEATSVEPLPREVEIELTTDDPFPEALLRARGSRVPSRGPIAPALVTAIVSEVSRYDDALVLFGGFGDPLRHPQFVEILQSLRVDRRGTGCTPYGLAVRTSAADLTDRHIEAMITCEVDILDVPLDAWTPELYRQLQSPNDSAVADLEAVLERLNRLSELREQRGSVKPVVVPELTKARENVHELDAFHDGWLRRVGAISISGYSYHAGQCEDRSVINMAPSRREPCRRIRSRCLVLADGTMTTCDQDFEGLHAIGRIGERSLEQLWRGTAFDRIRKAHRTGRFDATPLCTACNEWHRP